MLAKLINNDRGVTRLMVITLIVTCIAVAALLVSTILSEEDEEEGLPGFYAGPDGTGSLELRGAVLATGDGAGVNGVTFTVAIPEGGEPVNFTAPPVNVVSVSYDDGEQLVVDAPWTCAQYGAGDDDMMLDPGENFRIDVEVPNPGAGASFAIEVRTPDGEILVIERTLPQELSKVMNLW
ncbi:MAG: hypothetical protein FJZ95_08690 [Chloroflexi bacterium]|nr:hypothetical protein [Chloroflexota bacterium]